MSSLAWGSLPLDRYVLSNWNNESDLDPNERRRRLARSFTYSGDQGRVPYLCTSQDSPLANAPPITEWEGILAPLRTETQRRYALPSSFHPEGFENYGILWLRTCYDDNSDDQHAELLDNLNVDLALDVEQNVLNDASLYDYRGDWARIFEVMPERLFRQFEGHPSILEGIRDRYDRRQRLQGDFTTQYGSADGLDATTYRCAIEELHYEAIVGYLFVADRAALDTGKALVVFFDDCGRTVRSARIQPDLCEDTAGAWAEAQLRDQPEFNEADIGPDYMPGGVCGPPFS